MGTCCGAQRKFLEDLDYKQYVELKIIERDRLGNCINRSIVSFGLLPPIDQVSSFVDLGRTKLKATGCVLPGLDPRGECEKECQDSFAFLSCDTGFLAALFDGHGKDGRRVSLFCKDYVQRFFESNADSFELDPKIAIEEMVESCHDELAASGIESNLSGTTAVILVMNSLGIHAGSVGDSRAVLATIPKVNSMSFPEYRCLPYKRPIQPKRNLNAVALTTDQKPNHEDELKRIKSAGGVVEKLADDLGRPVGPYRVWKKKGNLPGLAMSRSIGDRVAHEIGVISAPILHSFNFYPQFDQFIVIASDGIWDVMDNFEVVNFVERFRASAQNSGSTYPARSSNSSIARLLCEEARYRWFGVIEDEDVMIDDISCVVLELNAENLNIEGGQVEERIVNKFKSIAIDSAVREKSGDVVRKDPTRGSMATGQEDIEEALLELQ